ncbi:MULTISPECIES: hypothetical protein [Paenibacillus]|uniref:Uncharacterized protein n=1 Tax=Paenibacillus typhae TaxID=1174501 RepID=A0A1G8J5W4_9BACL|nr:MULTISPECIES: hypothetical protein [Paenibacillus]MBY0010477.1 hypothetical protein [Paenibacillus typhae]MDF9840585.1 hypothetical protein [Paenibacillus sp. PastF-2]MDF9847167.1 hypothetical protein [Paenibacillus sp. PastM-2]MDF9853739.1 hypothetical protein [Paenibacillus sp. PastF-1]MDH6478775.1 hypothetical protein [Paenibacillus sp. PastH-2]
MPKPLVKNIDFFVAAMSQTFVSALQLDPDGMYSQVGYGIIEKFSEDYVRVKRFDGTVSHYDRGITKFQHNRA